LYRDSPLRLLDQWRSQVLNKGGGPDKYKKIYDPDFAELARQNFFEILFIKLAI